MRRAGGEVFAATEFCSKEQSSVLHSFIRSDEAGFTLFELLVTLFFIAIIAGGATFQARNLSDPIQNQTAITLGFIKQVRARAISSTSAYLIYPTSSTHLAVARGTACPATMPANPSSLVPSSFTADTLNVNLTEKVTFVSTTWGACVTQRGLFTGAASVQLIDPDGKTKTITIFLGGATKVS